MLEFLKSYILSVTVIVLFLAFIDIILPENSIKKYARFVTGLIVIVTILSPVFKIFDRKNDIETYILSYQNEYNTVFTNSNQIDVQRKVKLQTEQIFKEKLKESIEKEIYNSTKKRYSITDIALDKGNSDDIYSFANIKQIKLKILEDNSSIKSVDKVVIGEGNQKYDEYRDDEVVKILQTKYDINPSIIKFEK
ncbi:stage III sporulation protein AF [Caloramator quimbayensis]|uniref:Stage III sporulation protein AF n=1 Tax=Caloramator quimbayensis TaxID=1147123 RepID=A0A1T4WYL8_9CLOT|nr:stage III sporulation protein AF [Caloramator quimbayensis]SKA81958.1 stage III sporulation protein AF [Caloramator quimbayensis]